MKTTALLMFSFIFITEFLLGQPTGQNYSDNDNKKQFFPVAKQNNLRSFELFQDSSATMDENVRHQSDSIWVEKFPGTSKYFAQMPNLISSPSAKPFVMKPGNTTKQYLIIIDPTPGIKESISKP